MSAKTSLGSLSLYFPTAPISSQLLLSAHTSISPVSVSLHPTYEGTFDLSTSFARPEVVFDEEVEDPAHKDRKRRVEFDNFNRGTVHGSVEWEAEGKGRGEVEIQTSMASARLHF